MRVSLLGGAYRAKSVIASAQRCVNLYPEINPEDAVSPTTHYPTPGLTQLSLPTTAGVARGLYRASTGALFAVVGATLYSISATWQFTALGTIDAGNNPVSMSDNGTTLLLVDGTANGYTVTLATNVFSQITDTAFLGGDRVDFIDTFFILNEPGFPTFYTSNSNAVTFDALYFADKTVTPDPLAGVLALHDQIWLIGTLGTEIWYNDGGATFPFTKTAGAFVEHGCVAKYSIAKQDNFVYWLGQDLQGQGIVLAGSGYFANRISTHAIEAEWQTYLTISDAVGWTYQQGGHTFYVLNFPTADKTWVYDAATQLWHERAWADTNGMLHRHRAAFGAFAYSVNVALDWQTGALYKIDPANYTDNGQPIVRIRSFPHLMGDGKRVMYTQFMADIDCGQQLAGTSKAEALIYLRCSDTRGNSWGAYISQPMGSTGEYVKSVQWRRLGLARDRVFELSWSAPFATALNGAFVEAQDCGT